MGDCGHADIDPHNYEYAQSLCDGTSANDRRCKQTHVKHTVYTKLRMRITWK